MRAFLLLCSIAIGGCARLNPAFGDERGSDGDVSGEDTSGTTSAATSTGGQASVSSTTGSTPTTTATTGADVEPATGGGEVRFDLGAWMCTQEDDGELCGAYENTCAGVTTCRPYDPDGDGEALDTRCLLDGTVGLGDPCWPACTENTRRSCAAGLACVFDFGERAEVCRSLCRGSVDEPACAEGICFRERTDTDSPYGVCWGECDPYDPVSCPGGQSCAIGFDDPIPLCVPDPGPAIEGCEDDLCPAGEVCIPNELSNDCSVGSCCKDLCRLGVPDECPAEYTCVSFAEIGGADVPVGFCNPP